MPTMIWLVLHTAQTSEQCPLFLQCQQVAVTCPRILRAALIQILLGDQVEITKISNRIWHGNEVLVNFSTNEELRSQNSTAHHREEKPLLHLKD